MWCVGAWREAELACDGMGAGLGDGGQQAWERKGREGREGEGGGTRCVQGGALGAKA